MPKSLSDRAVIHRPAGRAGDFTKSCAFPGGYVSQGFGSSEEAVPAEMSVFQPQRHKTRSKLVLDVP